MSYLPECLPTRNIFIFSQRSVLDAPRGVTGVELGLITVHGDLANHLYLTRFKASLLCNLCKEDEIMDKYSFMFSPILKKKKKQEAECQ